MPAAPHQPKRSKGAQPGNFNSLRTGLNSARLAPFMRAYSPRCQELIRATLRHASAHALDGLTFSKVSTAGRLRGVARARAMERVIALLGEAPSTVVLPAEGLAQGERNLSSPVFDDVDALAERLRPVWTAHDAESEFAVNLAQAQARQTRPRAELAHRPRRVSRFRPAGAQPQNWNALRTGFQSKRFAPLFRRAGPQGRAVLRRAMVQSVEDAIAGLPPRMRYGSRRWDHAAHTIAREWGWQRVLWALRDARWWPPEAERGRRLPRAEAEARAAELERILAPVFAGVDVAPWSWVPDRPRGGDSSPLGDSLPSPRSGERGRG
jgi:hypothetical protein